MLGAADVAISSVTSVDCFGFEQFPSILIFLPEDGLAVSKHVVE